MAMMFFVFMLIAVSQASILPHNEANPCIAYGNGTTFDITDAFVWPVKGFSPNNTFQYWWDCKGTDTPCGWGVAVCQHADTQYSAGEVKGMRFYAPSFYVDRAVRIEYPTHNAQPSPNNEMGVGIRVTRVDVVIDDSIPPGNWTVASVVEGPFCEYTMTVFTACHGCKK